MLRQPPMRALERSEAARENRQSAAFCTNRRWLRSYTWAALVRSVTTGRGHPGFTAGSMEQVHGMTTMRPPGCGRSGAARALLILVLLGVSGCAQVDQVKSRLGQRFGEHGSATFVPAATRTAPASAEPASLASIVNEDLQRGHYDAGEKALRRYLAVHPADHAAQALLRQLTADPEQVLGRSWHAHLVQAGDSYSTLAARYLGDPGRFLILARYNGSNNPSILRVGTTVRVPASATGPAPAAADAAAAEHTPAEATPPVESTSAKASRLQKESLALRDQGHPQQALDRLGQALAIDPQLKPSGAGAVALRQQLLASYHQRAIVLYRDQQLDPAIALWNRVLAIEPGYEPARVYRTRALELKQRLKQL